MSVVFSSGGLEPWCDHRGIFCGHSASDGFAAGWVRRIDVAISEVEVPYRLNTSGGTNGGPNDIAEPHMVNAVSMAHGWQIQWRVVGPGLRRNFLLSSSNLF